MNKIKNLRLFKIFLFLANILLLLFKSNNNTLIEEENRYIVKRLLPEFSKELNRVLTFVGDDLDE